MNYIPFPREDLNKDADLESWRKIVPKKKGSWGVLKPYLAKTACILSTDVGLPKCWFSELPQGDNNALDVEHFRPKKSGSSLKAEKLEQIRKLSGLTEIPQLEEDYTYDWLEHDYRNYRLVTAMTNRSRAKHIYFPVLKGTTRLPKKNFPWKKKEYPLFLDPTDSHDAGLLYVQPTGEIAPTAPQTEITADDLKNVTAQWHTDGFNYLRAWVTIVLFRLNDQVFVTGRKEVFEATTFDLTTLEMLLSENPASQAIPRLIEHLFKRILPASPFSLAAISAMKAYIPQDLTKPDHINSAIQTMLQRLPDEIAKLKVDWTNP